MFRGLRRELEPPQPRRTVEPLEDEVDNCDEVREEDGGEDAEVLRFVQKAEALTTRLVLRNLRRLADSRYPDSGRLRWKHLALRGAHKEVLVTAVRRVRALGSPEGDSLTNKSRLILGAKGMGKSFLLESIVVGVQASLPPLDRTKLGKECQIVMVYAPSLRLEDEELARTPRSLIASALQSHGLLLENDGAVPAWAVEGLSPTCNTEFGTWLEEKQLRVFLVVDKTELAWAGSFGEAQAFHRACVSFAERIPFATLWLTGSTTKVRALAFGHLPHWTTPGAPAYGGETARSLNDTKFRAMNLFKQLKRDEARALVAAILRGARDEHVAPQYRQLKTLLLRTETGDEEAEAGGEGAGGAGAAGGAAGGGGGGAGAGHEGEEDGDDVVEKLMWAAAGSMRELEGLVSGEPERNQSERMAAEWTDDKFRAVCKAIMVTLRTRNDGAWNLRTNLWAYAELVDGTQVGSGDLRNAPLDGPRAEAYRALLRTVTVEDLMKWDDLGILDVVTSMGEWNVGFRHPMFLNQAEAMDTAEAGGIPWQHRLALQVPMGPTIKRRGTGECSTLQQ
jgi:hypothetical protein